MISKARTNSTAGIILAACTLLPGLIACGQQEQSGNSAGPASSSAEADSNAQFQKDLLRQLISAKPGEIIELPEGRFSITRGLTLNVDGVTLRGAGMDKTVLNFDEQIQGAEGLLVNANDFILEDIAFENTKGDAVKINEGKNLIVRRVRTEWTGGPKTSNGAYGIYPVQMDNVLIEDSVAIGASDAGIYVGQSTNIIVRRNRAEFNVAGIEVENSIGADVYENVATDNTGGILVFNMPNLPQAGHSTRVYNNTINNNNTDNFGAEGTAVASVPAGSGIVINSNDKVEIFDNQIKDNDTANILVTSYFTAGFYSEKESAENFDPYPEGIYIYNNEMSGAGSSPGDIRLQALRVAAYGLTGSLPDVIWDGAVDKEKLVNGQLPAELNLCIQNGDAGFANLDALNDFANVSKDVAPHKCALEKLPAIALEHSS